MFLPGLLVPEKGVQVLLPDNETVDEIPPLSCVHPRTGKVISIQGNDTFYISNSLIGL